MTWLDYKHIKSAVNFLDVLSYYGIELRPTGKDHLTGKCPLPNHSGDRSNTNAFHIDLKKNAYNCFSHCGGGNIIDFVAQMENCEFRVTYPHKSDPRVILGSKGEKLWEGLNLQQNKS